MAHNPHSINKKNFRRTYTARFVLRCFIMLATLGLFFVDKESFDVMIGLNFFRELSLFHILWGMWMFDMIMQLIPSAGYWPLGSKKVFSNHYVPTLRKITIPHLKQIMNKERLAKYLSISNIHEYINSVHFSKYVSRKRMAAFVVRSSKDAYYIAVLWILMIVAFAIANKVGAIDYHILMVIAVAFYLSDVICVRFWCPFRVYFMKNRCCTTCRIFNWDHLMMFSPFLFIPGFYTWSLCILAIAIFLIWEITFFVHPERFWEETNDRLSCRNCTDEICGRRLADYIPHD